MTDKSYFERDNFKLYKGDSFKILKRFDRNQFDMIFLDPPYFLSNGGITVQSGKMVNVNKATWDENMSQTKKLEYFSHMISTAKNLLKDTGTIWISGTFHNIYYVGVALENNGFKIINNITWKKTNPPPNLSCKSFTHSTETILWAKRSELKKHTFNYQEMKKINEGKQMKDVWEFPLTKKSEKRNGKFPTQKPLSLLNRIILASTNENDKVLDLYNGSGTTVISCLINNRRYVGIDLEKEYLELTIKRFQELEGKT